MNSSHELLAGRWRQILTTEGIPDDVLDGKQHPCPICKGKDRFRFDDKDEGRWYCNQCGAGDGYSLMCKKFGYTFLEAKTKAELIAGAIKVVHIKQGMSDAKKRELMNKVWNGAAPEAKGLRDYLASRGIPESLQFHPSIRWHPDLLCTNGNQRSQAVIIKYYRWGIDGRPEPATLQRHWVNLGTKMVMPAPIKLDGIFCPLGGKPGKRMLGVCEGYVTALSCMALQPVPGMMPVWSCLSAEQLMKFVPPPDVAMLYIYTDVDKSFTGQAAAYALAKKLRTHRPDLETVVCYPTSRQNVDYDYNDLLKGKPLCPTVENGKATDADATSRPASPASLFPNIPTNIDAGRDAISVERATTALTNSVRMAASRLEKPVDAANTVSLTLADGVIVPTILNSPKP